MTARRRATCTLVLVAVSAVLVAGSVLIGAEPINVQQAWAEWRAGKPWSQSPALSILVNQRVPRTLAALIAGAGLTVAGCAFQALLRNPLAEPFTLGIASAGAFGAWAATILLHGVGRRWSWLGFSPVEAAAFLFAGLDVLVIALVAARNRRLSPTVLLLTGVTLGILANAGILFLRYLAMPDRLIMMDRWLMGGVDVLGYEPVAALFIGVTPCLVILLAQAARFDQLSFSPETAAGRGVNVPRLQTVTFLVGSLMTGVIVSKVGPIGFVGLIVPHAVRSVTGSRHRTLLPLAMLVGGSFLCVCDVLARKILPGETPIGIITALIGGPVFLYLLIRRRFADWGA
jgi:iron complex transport system permease protein